MGRGVGVGDRVALFPRKQVGALNRGVAPSRMNTVLLIFPEI